MNGFWSIVKKEIVHIRRDPTALVLALLMPLIQLIIFGYAIDFDVRHIPAVVVDQDRSRESRDYLQRLKSTQYLDFDLSTDSPEEAASLLRAGRVKVAVIIPPGFAGDRLSGKPAQVGVLLDGSDSTTALRARFAFVPPPTSPLVGEVGERSEPGEGPIDARINVLFNPTMRTETFMVPGLIAVILQMVGMSLTAFSLVREKESGTLEQLMVSPVGRLALMTGKLLPYAGLAFLEMGLVLVAGYVLFDVRAAGSLLLLLALSLPFLIAALGFGLLISTIARTQAQALQMSLLFLMPSILMSGFAFPRETQPGILYLISGALPITHFMNVVRAIVVRGAGFSEVWTSVLALIIIATVCVALAVARFRKSLA